MRTRYMPNERTVFVIYLYLLYPIFSADWGSVPLELLPRKLTTRLQQTKSQDSDEKEVVLVGDQHIKEHNNGRVGC
jgi:hypothetical protein